MTNFIDLEDDNVCMHCNNVKGAVCPMCIHGEVGRQNLVELLTKAVFNRTF